jgi:hypothetical protein
MTTKMEKVLKSFVSECPISKVVFKKFMSGESVEKLASTTKMPIWLIEDMIRFTGRK